MQRIRYTLRHVLTGCQGTLFLRCDAPIETWSSARRKHVAYILKNIHHHRHPSPTTISVIQKFGGHSSGEKGGEELLAQTRHFLFILRLANAIYMKAGSIFFLVMKMLRKHDQVSHGFFLVSFVPFLDLITSEIKSKNDFLFGLHTHLSQVTSASPDACFECIDCSACEEKFFFIIEGVANGKAHCRMHAELLKTSIIFRGLPFSSAHHMME